METSENGINILKSLEGFSSIPYADGKGYSIGYGHFISNGEKFNFITKEQGEQILKTDLKIYERNVNYAIHITLNQNQFDSLVIWAYNTGKTKSTLYDLINKHSSNTDIGNFWQNTYISSNGEVLQALRKRREIEFALFNLKPKSVLLGGIIAFSVILILKSIFKTS